MLFSPTSYSLWINAISNFIMKTELGWLKFKLCCISCPLCVLCLVSTCFHEKLNILQTKIATFISCLTGLVCITYEQYGLYHHKCHSGLVFMKLLRIRIKIRLKLKILLIWTFFKPTVTSILLTDGFVKICTPNKTSRNYKLFLWK